MHRALGRPGQKTSLISPFMIRTAGIIVNDIAVQHSIKQDSHCILFPERNVTLQLELKDTQSVLPIRRPTLDELQYVERF